MIQTFLRNCEAGSVEDVISLFKEAIAEFLNTGLQAEMTDISVRITTITQTNRPGNSRYGNTPKKLRTGMGEIKIEMLRDWTRLRR